MAGDMVHNCFSDHMTPGTWIMESGAQVSGCAVFPGCTGNTEQQLQAMAHLRPDACTGTPGFLRILTEKAAGSGQGATRQPCTWNAPPPPKVWQWQWP